MAHIFDWKKLGLLLNIHEMDEDHKELVGKMNHLYEAKISGSNHKDLVLKLDELEKTIVEHFKNEEEYMRDVGYPEYDSHKDAHDHLLKKFKEFKSEFLTKQKLPDSIFTFLKGWISSHILHLDKRYSEFVNSSTQNTKT